MVTLNPFQNLQNNRKSYYKKQSHTIKRKCLDKMSREPFSIAYQKLLHGAPLIGVYGFGAIQRTHEHEMPLGLFGVVIGEVGAR